jgi:hypothetical protein
MPKLDQTQKLPDYLSLATSAAVDSAAALAGQFSNESYCASPGSGAFVKWRTAPFCVLYLPRLRR